VTIVVIAIYLLLVVGIGVWSHRAFRGTGEDYFVASRSVGPFLLLASLFGTNMTAFSLLGASGEAYHRGVGVFSLMASSTALLSPLVFYFLGTRICEIGRDERFLTQIQFFSTRWESKALGVLLFLVLIGLLIPYLLIGVMGGGITLNQITDGTIPQWVGSLLICAVVVTYVMTGGLRGTAWANAFQTVVFMTLGAATFAIILYQKGGMTAALDGVDPSLLMHGERISGWKLLSYTTIPISVAMFPHIFMHWLTAERPQAFRVPIVLYPLCILVVWIPSVLVGVMSTSDFPGLVGPEANSVMIQMIGLYAPEMMAGLLAAGVFAAVMSSLDSQVLALSTLFTQDVVRRTTAGDRMTEGNQVMVGRAFVLVILGATFALSLVTERSIFKLSVWSFTGFAALLPVVVAALYWRRSTRQGAIASVLVTAGLWIYFFTQASRIPNYSVGGTGMMPALPMLLASAVALVVVSLATTPPSRQTIDRFIPPQRHP